MTVSGEVIRISDDQLILERSGKNGLEEYIVGFDQIASLEARKGSSAIPLVLVGAALVVVVVAVVMAATMENVEEVTFKSLDELV